jgi:uncharacterized membrane protein
MSDWYYAVNNEQKGPINESELKANLATNKIPVDSLVWKEGMDNWTPANQVPAFSFRQPPIPAKIQPTAATTPAPLPSTPATAGTKVVAASPEVNNPESTKPVDFSTLIGPPEALEVDAEDAERNKTSGIIAYIPLLFLIPLLTVKDSPYAKYHANQGFVLFLLELVVLIVVQIIDKVLELVGLSTLDWVIGLVYLGPLGLFIFGVVNAAYGKCVPLPLVGGVKLVK